MLKGVLIFIPHLFPLFLLLTFSMYLFGEKILRVTSEDSRRRRYILKLFITPERREWVSFTLSWRRSLSYRNQSINFLCKSFDWFLYDRDSVTNDFAHFRSMFLFYPPWKHLKSQKINVLRGRKKEPWL